MKAFPLIALAIVFAGGCGQSDKKSPPREAPPRESPGDDAVVLKVEGMH